MASPDDWYPAELRTELAALDEQARAFDAIGDPLMRGALQSILALTRESHIGRAVADRQAVEIKALTARINGLQSQLNARKGRKVT